MKNNDYFLQKFNKNSTFAVTFCDDVINGDVIYLILKHVFIIKEKLCQSFWQLVKSFTFEAKKIEGGIPLRFLGLKEGF